MRTKLLILVLLTAVLSAAVIAQEDLKPVKVNEFGKISCDDLLARVDGLFNQLNNNPAAEGFIVISAPKDNLASMLSMENRLRGAFTQELHEPNRITFIRTLAGDQMKVEFWIVPSPSGVNWPETSPTQIKAVLPADSLPFNIRFEMDQICDPNPLEPLTGELLENNPEGQIYVVVNYGSARQRTNQINEAIKLLKPYPRSHIRFLLRKYGQGWNDYWFVVKPMPKLHFFDA